MLIIKYTLALVFMYYYQIFRISFSNNYIYKQTQYHCLISMQDYELLSKLGEGSFGIVHKARDKRNNIVCVIKIVDTSKMNQKLKKSAMAEGTLMKEMDSPFIVKHLNTFLNKSSLNIVMEYCPKGDLAAYMKSQMGKPLKEQTIWKFSIQMMGGLRDLHNKKILHRDIKSLNIFLDDNYNAKIGDLGVAKTMKSEFAHTIVGTPYYLSPQMCEQKPYNEKTDIWAMGCVIYQLCSGRRPFEANNQAALALKIVVGKYQKLPSHISSDLNWIVNSCLSVDYKRRPTASYLLQMPKTKQWAEKLNINTCSNSNKSLVGSPNQIKSQDIKEKQLVLQKGDSNEKMEVVTNNKNINSKPEIEKIKQVSKQAKQKYKLSKDGEKNVVEVFNNKIAHDPKPTKLSGAKRLQFLSKQKQADKIKKEEQNKSIRQSSKERPKQSQEKLKSTAQKPAVHIPTPKKPPIVKMEDKKINRSQYVSQPTPTVQQKKQRQEKLMDLTINRYLPENFKKKKQIDLEDEGRIQEVQLGNDDDSSQEQKKVNEKSENSKINIIKMAQQSVDDDQLMKDFGMPPKPIVSPKKAKSKQQESIQEKKQFKLEKTAIEIDWNKVEKLERYKKKQLPTAKAKQPSKVEVLQMQCQEQSIQQQINQNRAFISEDQQQEASDKVDPHMQKSDQKENLLIEDFTSKQQDIQNKSQENKKRKSELTRMKEHLQGELLKNIKKSEYEKIKYNLKDCQQNQINSFITLFKNNIQVINLFYRILYYDHQIDRCNQNIAQLEHKLASIMIQKS